VVEEEAARQIEEARQKRVEERDSQRAQQLADVKAKAQEDVEAERKQAKLEQARMHAEHKRIAAEADALRKVEEASKERLAQLELKKEQAQKDKVQAKLIGNRGGQQRAKVSFGMPFKKK